MRTKKTILERFWEKVSIPENPNGCWIWQAGCLKGYGAFSNGKKQIAAHKFAYEQLFGVVPNGMELDHLCRNKRCVNPNHLETVLHIENMSRGKLGKLGHFNKTKTHCPYGHPYSTENTYFYRQTNGSLGRLCLTCSRKRSHHIKKAPTLTD